MSEMDDWKQVEAAIKNVSNQLQFSAMARAGDPSQHDDMKMEAIWAGTLEAALAALSRLKPKDGEVVVPVMPTFEMLDAGNSDYEHDGSTSGQMLKSIREDKIREIYKRMISARPERKTDGQ